MKIAASIAALACIVLLVAERHVVACMIASGAHYERAGYQLLAAPELAPASRSGAAQDWSQARKRVGALLGPLVSEPVVLLPATQDDARTLGLAEEVPGASYSLPWGTYLVFTERGRNIDVMAHELVHAELAARLGYLRYSLVLPTWFDEGLAMQVDLRDEEIARVIREGLPLPSVESLESRREFWSGETAKSYAASQVEVARWLESDGHPGAGAFVDALARSASFDALYAATEQVGQR